MCAQTNWAFLWLNILSRTIVLCVSIIRVSGLNELVFILVCLAICENHRHVYKVEINSGLNHGNSPSNWRYKANLYTCVYIYSRNLYKGHSRESENVSFISSCHLYTGSYYIHHSVMGKMRLSFIDRFPLRQVWQ